MKEKFIYVVIGSAEGMGTSIDPDCVFEEALEAAKKAHDLSEKYECQEFIVQDIDITRFVNNNDAITEAIGEHADAIREVANAFHDIREDLHELLICSCSVGALGNTATHPTIVLQHEGVNNE